MRGTPTAALAMTLALAPAWADEAVLADGTKLTGELVTAVMKAGDGAVRQLGRDELLVLTTTRPGTGGAKAAAPGWGTRPGAPPATTTPSGVTVRPLPAPAGIPADAPPPPAAAPEPNLVIDMHWEATSDTPELAPPSPYVRWPGDVGEVFVFRPVWRKDRSRWQRIGSIRRVVNQKVPTLDDATELQLYRQLIRDENQTRESILAEVESRRTYVHQMHYHFAADVKLPPGTWTVYVHMPKLRRHRVFSGVVFRMGEVQHLEYTWTNHSTFGR